MLNFICREDDSHYVNLARFLRKDDTKAEGDEKGNKNIEELHILPPFSLRDSKRRARQLASIIESFYLRVYFCK